MKICMGLSGGLDSSTLLAILLDNDEDVLCLGFEYGSKHNKYEIEAAKKIANYYNVDYKLIDLTNVGKILKSNLLLSGGSIPEGHYQQENMKLTVVPGRNLMFASILAGYAESNDCQAIALGVHQGDHCIPYDEFVTSDYGKVTINDLNVGDQILSKNIKTGVVSFKEVVKKVNNGIREDILNIRTTGGRLLSLTSNHKVFQVERSNFTRHYGWDKKIIEVPAEKLKVGDWLLTPMTNRELIENMNKIGDSKIVQIKEITNGKPKLVFDIEVEENHNFFAGKGSGLLVSNSIYPDCRKEFIKTLDSCIYLSTDRKVEVITPLINMDKSEIVSEGLDLEVPYQLTRTCYSDQDKSCGRCGSCNERLEAFARNGVEDPIEYE